MLNITISNTETGETREFECDFLVGSAATYDEEMTLKTSRIKQGIKGDLIATGKGSRQIALELLRDAKQKKKKEL